MTTPTTLVQPGRGTGPNHGWRKVVPDDLAERWSGLRVPSANRPVDRGGRRRSFKNPNPRVRDPLVLHLRFSPRGPLRFDDVGLYLGAPQPLFGGFQLPVGHDDVVYTGGDTCLLDRPGPTLGG
jgi:hypothetical protein